MIDFASLRRAHAKEDPDVPDSFVGIKGNTFYVPLGVPTQGDFSEEENRELFLLLYRVLRKFVHRLRTYGKEDKHARSDRDGAGQGKAPQERFHVVMEEKEKEEVVYTRFAIDDVLDIYDDLALFGLRTRLRASEDPDYSRIHFHLHKGIFMEDGAVYLDTMMLPAKAPERFATDLVQLYCLLYEDIHRALRELDRVRPEVRAEAERLREEHLWPGASLFGPNWKACLSELRDLLTRVEQFTAYRDEAFWAYYDAVKRVLYPNHRMQNEGIFWGIDKFWIVWEDVCHTYFSSRSGWVILYADRMDREIKEDRIRNLLSISLNEKIISHMRPDLVGKLALPFVASHFEFRARHPLGDQELLACQMVEDQMVEEKEGESNEYMRKMPTYEHSWLFVNMPNGVERVTLGENICYDLEKETEAGLVRSGYVKYYIDELKKLGHNVDDIEVRNSKNDGPGWLVSGVGIYRINTNVAENELKKNMSNVFTEVRVADDVDENKKSFFKNFSYENATRSKVGPLLKELREEELAERFGSLGSLLIMAVRSFDKNDKDVEDYCRVIDFKYENPEKYEKYGEHMESDKKIVDDICKQFAYQVALQSGKYAVQNMIVCPHEKHGIRFLKEVSIWIERLSAIDAFKVYIEVE